MSVDFNIFDAQKFSKFTFLSDKIDTVVKTNEIGTLILDSYISNLQNETQNEEEVKDVCVLDSYIAEISDLYGFDVKNHLENEGCKGKSGSTLKISLPKLNADLWENLPNNILVVGLGEKTLDDCRKAGLELGRGTVGTQSACVPFVDSLTDEQQIAFFDGILLSCYRQTRIASTNDLKDPVVNIFVLTQNEERVSENLQESRRIAEATILARTLECVPSNVKNPKWLAENFEELVKQCENLDGELVFECMNADELRERGFNAILAVGSASVTPPCLVTIKWIPKNVRANTPKIVFVGKGITYDTGGLSLKPRESMVPMKTDMSGTATVVSAILSIAKAGLNVEVTAVATMAENAMGASSYRPGDVVKTYAGSTVEILNTDAEGRMVMADGLDYAISDLQADIVVDVATLTGAATFGLGRFHAATYSNDNEVWNKMSKASSVIGENVWRMPLVDDYREVLHSPIADICHVETEGTVGAGSITAALFLEHFVKGHKWCHLDIAGVGRAGKPMGEVSTNQPTGFGAALLYGFVKEYDK